VIKHRARRKSVVDFLATNTSIANLGTELKQEISEVKQEVLLVRTEMPKNKEETNEKIEQIRSEMRQQFRWLFNFDAFVVTTFLTKVN